MREKEKLKAIEKQFTKLVNIIGKEIGMICIVDTKYVVNVS